MHARVGARQQEVRDFEPSSAGSPKPPSGVAITFSLALLVAATLVAGISISGRGTVLD